MTMLTPADATALPVSAAFDRLCRAPTGRNATNRRGGGAPTVVTVIHGCRNSSDRYAAANLGAGHAGRAFVVTYNCFRYLALLSWC